MKKYHYIAASIALMISATAAKAENGPVTRGGPLVGQTFSQCNVAPRYQLNTTRRQLSRGGWGGPTQDAGGADQWGNPTWSTSYTNSVFVAQRRLVQRPYTYLVPSDNTGIQPCEVF